MAPSGKEKDCHCQCLTDYHTDQALTLKFCDHVNISDRELLVAQKLMKQPSVRCENDRLREAGSSNAIETFNAADDMNTFGGFRRGFLNSRSRSTMESSPECNNDLDEVRKGESEKKKKTKKKPTNKIEEHTPEMAERPPLIQKETEELLPLKCHRCQKDIVQKSDSYFFMDCSERCNLFLHSSCFKDEMNKQGRSKKRDQKEARCPTDSCIGKIYDIMVNEVDKEQEKYLACNPRPEAPKKEDKRKMKKQQSTRTAVTDSATNMKRAQSECTEDSQEQENDQEDIKEVSFEIQQPTPIDLNAAVKRLEPERHDEITEKYGLYESEGGLQSNRKERRKREKREMVTLNVIDNNMLQKAEQSRNEISDYYEPNTQNDTFFEGIPSTSSLNTGVLPQFSSNMHREVIVNNCDREILDDPINFPKVSDIGSLERLVEEILPYKEDILGNIPQDGELYMLRSIFDAIFCDDHNPFTPNGVKFSDIRKELERVFNFKETSSSDGGLARQFIDMTRWFTVSKSQGKIFYRKKGAQVQPKQNSIISPERNENRGPSQENAPSISANGVPQKPDRNSPEKVSVEREPMRPQNPGPMRQQNPPNVMTNSPSTPRFANLSFGAQQFVGSPPPGINLPTMHPPGIPIHPIPGQFDPYAFVPMHRQDDTQKLHDELDRLRKENSDFEKAYRESAKECADLYKEKLRLLKEITSSKENERKLKEEHCLETNQWKSEIEKLTEDRNRSKISHDDQPRVQLLQAELAKVRKENYSNIEKRSITKKKELAEATISHIDQICYMLNSYLIDESHGGDEKTHRKRQLTSFEKLKQEWEGVYQATVKRLFELNNLVTTENTIIPSVPRMNDDCEQLFYEHLGNVKNEAQIQSSEILKEIRGQITSQCSRHNIQLPEDSKLIHLIARYIANNASMLGVSMIINNTKCMHYVLDAIGTPRGFSFGSNGSAWQVPAPVASPSFTPNSTAFLDTPTNKMGSNSSAPYSFKKPSLRKQVPREIDFATHECTICFEKFDSASSARQCPGCSEPFHHHCIKTWLAGGGVSSTNDCPTCNHVWPDDDEYPRLAC